MLIFKKNLKLIPATDQGILTGAEQNHRTKRRTQFEASSPLFWRRCRDLGANSFCFYDYWGVSSEGREFGNSPSRISEGFRQTIIVFRAAFNVRRAVEIMKTATALCLIVSFGMWAKIIYDLPIW